MLTTTYATLPVMLGITSASTHKLSNPSEKLITSYDNTNEIRIRMTYRSWVRSKYQEVCDKINCNVTMCHNWNIAGVTQLVECQPSKLNVAGSSPVARFGYNDLAER